MSVQEFSIKVTAESGKLRADLPATSIEADDAEGLIGQADLLVEAIRARVRMAIEDAAEEVSLRDVEGRALRREALEQLAARYPAPAEWLDEPD
jgi:hypothetical protein